MTPFLQTIQGSKLVADNALDPNADPAGMPRAMGQLSAWLGRATQESRAGLNSLRGSTEQRNDLGEALQHAIEECRLHSPIEASFSEVGKAEEMHPIVRDEIYRISYEAIRNACAHSKSTRLEVELNYSRDMSVRVRDNGVGIDPSVLDHGREGHFGLQGKQAHYGQLAKLRNGGHSGGPRTYCLPNGESNPLRKDQTLSYAVKLTAQSQLIF